MTEENTFLKGRILPPLMKFAIPVLLALFLQAMYGAVDLMVVGQFCGAADVSAVATGSQIMLIVTGIITGLSMGMTILIAQKTGNGDQKGVGDVVGTGIWLFGGLGIVLTLGMLFFTPALTAVMQTPPEAFEKTIHYVRICSGGTLFIVAYNVISGIFRGIGNARLPLYFVFIACLANIAGDLFFVVWLKMDASGTALATVLAQLISVAFSVVVILKRGFPFPFGKENLRPQKQMIRHIVKLGAPVALQDCCNELSFLILIGIVNTLGLTASAGVGVAERLVMFMLLIPIAYMSSVSAFVAQNIGANQAKRAEKSMWVGMATAACFGAVMFYISFFHGAFLATLFSSEMAVVQAAASFLKATSIECFLLAITSCFSGYFSGLGKTVFVMFQGMCGAFLVRIPCAYYFSIQPDVTLFKIGLSAVFAALFALLISTAFYVFLKWQSRH